MQVSLKHFVGAFALAFLFNGEEDLLIAARRGLAAGDWLWRRRNVSRLRCDCLAPFTDKISYLEEGDWAVLSRENVEIFDENDKPVTREKIKSNATSFLIDKGNHRHFMEKEIHEQPEVISQTMSHYIDFAHGSAKNLEGSIDFAKIDRLAISACGTAYYAGLVAKYWFERLARLPVDIDVASEFRYREMPLSSKDAALFVSQSGETADTLASLRYCKAQGMQIGAVVNVRESTIARESNIVFPTLAGPEIGVASTKAFTCQLSVLASLAIHAARARGKISVEQEQALVRNLAEAPRYASLALKLDNEIQKVAHEHVARQARAVSWARC